MTVMKQGVPGADEKNESKQVPLKFLGKNKAGIENISHDDIDKYDQNQSEGNPGHTPANPFICCVYPGT